MQNEVRRGKDVKKNKDICNLKKRGRVDEFRGCSNAYISFKLLFVHGGVTAGGLLTH